MKTTLPKKIESIQDAKIFLLDLIRNNEIYHPEDDAHDIIWGACKEPSSKEKDQLNKLMEDIYELYYRENFDPCEFILDNSNL